MTGAEPGTSELAGDEVLAWTVIGFVVSVTWAEVRPVVAATDETPAVSMVAAEAVLICGVAPVETAAVVCVAVGGEVVA